jgi:hypothetical protein
MDKNNYNTFEWGGDKMCCGHIELKLKTGILFFYCIKIKLYRTMVIGYVR